MHVIFLLSSVPVSLCILSLLPHEQKVPNIVQQPGMVPKWYGDIIQGEFSYSYNSELNKKEWFNIVKNTLI